MTPILCEKHGSWPCYTCLQEENEILRNRLRISMEGAVMLSKQLDRAMTVCRWVAERERVTGVVKWLYKLKAAREKDPNFHIEYNRKMDEAYNLAKELVSEDAQT